MKTRVYLLKYGKRVDIRIDIDIKIVLLKKLYNILIWKLNSHVTDGINNNFIKKGIKISIPRASRGTNSNESVLHLNSVI